MADKVHSSDSGTPTFLNSNNANKVQHVEFDTVNMVKGDRVRMFQRLPFFGSMISRIPIRILPVDSPIKTAATDGKIIYYNPLFMHLIGEEGRLFVVAHEIMHIINCTFARKGDRINKIWNIATDIINNDMLVSSGFDMPKNSVINEALSNLKNLFPDMNDETQEHYNRIFKSDSKLEHKPMGLYYPELMKEHNCKTAEDVYEFLISKEGESFMKKKNINPDENPTLDIHIDFDEMTPEQVQEVKDIIEQSIQTTSKSNIPLGIRRLIDGLHDHKIPWTSEIHAESLSFEIDDYRMVPPDQGMFYQGITIPSVNYSRKLNVAFGIDTSGSMGQQDVADALSEIVGISREFDEFTITVFCCDTVAYKSHVFTKNNIFELEEFEIEGGGGTLFYPVFERFIEVQNNGDEPYDWHIFFTDGYGEGWCEQYQYRVNNMLWLLNKFAKRYKGELLVSPWGKTIYYDKYE